MAEDNTGTAVALAGSSVVREEGVVRRAPLPVADLRAAALLAEETGYQALFVPDHGVWEPFPLLASLAERTDRIRLGPGAVPMTSRDPASMAAAAWTLAQVSEGRAILGLASGSERRVARVEEYAAEVRRRTGDIPLYLAALGPRMIGAAGRVADGVLLNWCTPERVATAVELLEREGRRVSVAVYVRACLGHDDDTALAALREATGMYAGIPGYRRQFDLMGLGSEAEAAAEAFSSGSLDRVPEALVAGVSVWGGQERAAERLQAYREAGADLVVVYPVPAQEPVSSLMGTIMAAAPTPAVEH
jgi:alkanesulfonate monooxygenase SsuD/methylene tetrahydromethanopterin reductase-like flavin-dependent oxidoreductase (luciferase family)